MTAPMSVMQRAREVQENLDPRFPNYMKTMMRSNVTRGFSLFLPKLLRIQLPNEDATIILEDEDKIQYSARYHFDRKSLTAGWKDFSDAHNLVEGDVLVFHMVERTKFKIYIIRPSSLNEVDAALSLMHLRAATNEIAASSGQLDLP